MRLQEYQAKQIFRQFGIKVPKGRIARSLDEVKNIVEELGGKVVLKAQVLVGGRGKAGGVIKAYSIEEALDNAKKLFGRIIKGHIVKKIYVEEMLDIEKELYVGFTYDSTNYCIDMIVGSIGGIDIEEIAVKHPDKIAVKHLDPNNDLWDYIVREVLYEAQIPKEYFNEVFSVVKKLYQVFKSYDAELCEINPLAITKDGNIYAVDARLNIDDDALYRHKDIMELKDFTQMNILERIAEQEHLKYVKIEGNIGIIAAGAGMGMATADLIYLYNGQPANFLDIGGSTPEVVEKSFRLLLQDKDVKVIFVNVLGGLTRCDWIANGIINAIEKLNITLPIVIRLAGTNENEGKTLIKEYITKTSKNNIILVETMEEGAKKAIELSSDNYGHHC